MKKRFRRLLPIVIFGMVILTGCTTNTTSENIPTMTESAPIPENNITEESALNDTYFSKRDLSGEVDIQNAVEIVLQDNSISANSDGVTILGSTITITKEGTYIFSGTLSDGNIIVNTGKEEKVQIVLDGVSITSSTFAPIYVAQADKAFVTLTEGTTNTLTNGGSFTQIDDNTVDAVIFSKDDITLNGTGTLKIVSPAGEGITGKDEVTITGGSYEISSAKTAIRANESVAIADGNFTIAADTDGIKAEKSDDDSIGHIYIAGGSFNIQAGDDGIHGTTTLVIDGGTFHITAAEGLEATEITINEGTIAIEASDDGINAAKKSSLYSPKVEINGGDITIVMGNGDTDGVDANGDIMINGGTVNVTGPSTFDYDGTGTINGGTVIANGEEITVLPNQMMGHGGMRGQMDGVERQKGERMEPKDRMRKQNGEMKGPREGLREPEDAMYGPEEGMK